MNKIVYTKTNAVLLVLILVAGTTVAISSIIGTAAAQVPPGPGGQGPPGLDGQGPPSRILPENLYEVKGDGANGDDLATDVAICDEGDVAISGGFQGASFDGPIERLSLIPFETPFPDPFPPDYPFDRWSAHIDGDRVFIGAWAICFDNPPLRP